MKVESNPDTKKKREVENIFRSKKLTYIMKLTTLK